MTTSARVPQLERAAGSPRCLPFACRDLITRGNTLCDLYVQKEGYKQGLRLGLASTAKCAKIGRGSYSDNHQGVIIDRLISCCPVLLNLPCALV